jgi:hypothetical protein
MERKMGNFLELPVTKLLGKKFVFKEFSHWKEKVTFYLCGRLFTNPRYMCRSSETEGLCPGEYTVY